MSNIKDTQPNPVVKSSKRKTRLIAALGFILLLVLGVFGGYGAGMAQRRSAQATVVAQQVEDQFQRGVQAIETGQYELAKQYFEFVIRNAPDYPGIQDQYTELLLRMSISPTPTFTPTPTLTPTPDLRGAEAIFNSARERLNAKDWDGVIATLDSLRKINPTYRAVEVDGMYYIALRNRGVGKILAAQCQDINLEGGIYDLNLAERFGYLDGYADGLRTYARLYMTAASFWELDWYQARYFFGQVMAGLPYLMDASCLSATERWRIATVKYADQLVASGDYCGASQLYEEALLVSSPQNDEIVVTATAVYVQCVGTPTPVWTPTTAASDTPSSSP